EQGGFTRKRDAQAYEDEQNRIVRHLKGGLVTKAQLTAAEHARRPIAEHVADYRAELQGRRRTKHHVEFTMNAIESAIKMCGWQTVADIDAVQFGRAIDSKGARAFNDHRQAL